MCVCVSSPYDFVNIENWTVAILIEIWHRVILMAGWESINLNRLFAVQVFSPIIQTPSFKSVFVNDGEIETFFMHDLCTFAEFKVISDDIT